MKEEENQIENKNKKNNVTLGVIVVLLVVVALYLGFNNRVELEEEIASQNEEQVTEENIDVSEEVEESVGNGASVTDERSLEDKKYDEIMKNASLAYNAENYSDALSLYDEALKIKDLDVVYAKKYMTYMKLGEYDLAMENLDKARELKPDFNQYWIWTIEMKRDIEKAPYMELEAIYEEGIDKVEITAKVNFVLFFARVSEEMGKTEKAIELWKYAQELYPTNEDLYQGEIDRLELIQ